MHRKCDLSVGREAGEHVLQGGYLVGCLVETPANSLPLDVPPQVCDELQAHIKRGLKVRPGKASYSCRVANHLQIVAPRAGHPAQGQAVESCIREHEQGDIGRHSLRELGVADIQDGGETHGYAAGRPIGAKPQRGPGAGNIPSIHHTSPTIKRDLDTGL